MGIGGGVDADQSLPVAGQLTGPELFSLETPYRAVLAGPVAAAGNGRILWVTGGPDAIPGRKRGEASAFSISWSELRESGDCGRTWGRPRVLLRGTEEFLEPSAFALLPLAAGKVLLIGGRYSYYSPDGDPAESLLEGYTRVSSDHGKTWSGLRPLPTGERYLSAGLSAAQLSTGRVIFPFGFLSGQARGRFQVSVMDSDDDGQAWFRSPSVLQVGGEGIESGAIEPSTVELPDGRLWMLIRAQTGFLWESFSSDQGMTWEPARQSRFPSSNAPAVLLRLSGGRIVVTWNNSPTRPVPRRFQPNSGEYLDRKQKTTKTRQDRQD